jgi:hypothetical protein
MHRIWYGLISWHKWFQAVLFFGGWKEISFDWLHFCTSNASYMVGYLVSDR